MQIKITTPAGEYTTTTDALKAAEWTHDGESPSYAICPASDIYGRHGAPYEDNVLTIQAGDSCEDWSAIEATVEATDAAGAPVRLYISAASIWADDGASSIFAEPAGGDYTRATVEDEDGCELQTADIERIVGAECEREGIDYDAAAADWLAENTDDKTRYWMDDHRGFANEWTLYIDPQGREALTIGDLEGTTCPDKADHLREIDAEDVPGLLADAVRTPEDYKAEHLAESSVCAIVLD